MTLTRAQLCILRCLTTTCWEYSLRSYLLSRNGATEQELQQMFESGLVRCMTKQRVQRIVLTDKGRTAYRQQRVGQYF